MKQIRAAGAATNIKNASSRAGFLFCAHQRDPRKGFIPIFKNLAESDSLDQFTTQTGSAIVAVLLAAPAPGSYVGQRLLEA